MVLNPGATIEYHASNYVFNDTSLTQTIPGSASGSAWIVVVWAFNRSGDIGERATFTGAPQWTELYNQTAPSGSIYLGIWWRFASYFDDSITVSFSDANLDICSHVMRAQNLPDGLEVYALETAELPPNNSGLYDYRAPSIALPNGANNSNTNGFLISSIAIRSSANIGGNDVYPEPSEFGGTNSENFRQEWYGDYDPPGPASAWHFLTAIKRFNLQISGTPPSAQGMRVAFYDKEGTHYSMYSFSLLLSSPSGTTNDNEIPNVGWSVADDLPTEDISRPQFARRALEIVVPIGYEPTEAVVLRNPVIPDVLYRGLPRNSTRSGGLVRMELEPIEARWQRAISKHSFQQVGTFTGAQVLQALLTQRQTEFDFLQWETIPALYWPDGTIPQLINPATQLDERTSVYDEVLQILVAFPGYTVDWTPDNRLRIVIPPFAPNAPAPKILNSRDGNYVRTGYVKTELVRSVRVKSQPYAFSGSRELVVRPVSLRLADQEFATAAIANKPDASTRGNISAASTTLNVLDASIFAVNDQLYIAGAGTGGQPLMAQITAISGNTITLNTAASTNANDVLVRFLHNYPPPPDNIGIESTARQYGAGYIEATYVQPFAENTIVDTSTVHASVRLDTWRLPALPPPLPYQTTDQAVDIPITTNWTNVYTGNLRDRLAMIFEINSNRIYVDARLVDGGVEWRIRASTYGDGGVNWGSVSIRRWFAGFRFALEARASVWKRGAATFSAEYRNPNGYLDLPEIDVSATGITNSEQLQRLARLIAEYRSRQAAQQWTLELSQPWALLPTDKGRRLELPGGVVVVADGYRLGINYGAQDVAAPFICNAWQYTQLTYILSNEAGDLLAHANGDVLGR